MPRVGDGYLLHTAKDTSFSIFFIVTRMMELTFRRSENSKQSRAIFQDFYPGKKDFSSRKKGFVLEKGFYPGKKDFSSRKKGFVPEKRIFIREKRTFCPGKKILSRKKGFLSGKKAWEKLPFRNFQSNHFELRFPFPVRETFISDDRGPRPPPPPQSAEFPLRSISYTGQFPRKTSQR